MGTQEKPVETPGDSGDTWGLHGTQEKPGDSWGLRRNLGTPGDPGETWTLVGASELQELKDLLI